MPEDDPLIFWHEVHEIAGGQMPVFHAAVRERWRPLIEDGGDARLLWFWDHGHGTGPSFVRPMKLSGGDPRCDVVATGEARYVPTSTCGNIRMLRSVGSLVSPPSSASAGR